MPNACPAFYARLTASLYDIQVSRLDAHKVSRRTMYDRRKSRPRQILVSLFCLCALGYFAYHAIVGKRGLEARSRLIERSRQLGPEIERLEAVRARLEQEVRLLDAADPDIVEELAIELLGFARPGDRVVVLPAERPKATPKRPPAGQ